MRLEDARATVYDMALQVISKQISSRTTRLQSLCRAPCKYRGRHTGDTVTISTVNVNEGSVHGQRKMENGWMDHRSGIHQDRSYSLLWITGKGSDVRGAEWLHHRFWSGLGAGGQRRYERTQHACRREQIDILDA